uniref:Prothymosin alpha isoform X3 n=1 Tax=Pogona vitticeps TaxID=103695 RepID=A0ABM5G445_9SAUR
MIVVGLPYPAFRAEDRPGPGGHVECGKKAPTHRRTPFTPSGASLRIRSAGDRCLRDLKEKKEVVEETENGRDAPANGNAENEENGEQEAENEVDEEEEEVGDEEEDEEEGLLGILTVGAGTRTLFCSGAEESGTNPWASFYPPHCG